MSNAKVFGQHVFAFIVSHAVAAACLVVACTAFFMDLKGMHWVNLVLVTSVLAAFFSVPILIAQLARFNIQVAIAIIACADATVFFHVVSREPGLQGMPGSIAIIFWLGLFAVGILTAAATSFSYRRIASVASDKA